MKSGNYSLRLLVKTKTIKEYDHNGRTFVEGRKGSEFNVEFKNDSTERVLVIPSVDGLSTLDGELATPESKGYVVGANQTLVIPGWTVDGENVARFLFQDKDKSYAAASVSSGTTNAGVVGVIVFSENKPEKAKDPVKEIHHHHHYREVQPQPIYNPRPWIYGAGGTGTLSGTAGGVPPFTSTAVAMNNTQLPATNTIATTEAQYREMLLGQPIASVTKSMSNSVTESTDEPVFGLGTGWGRKAEFKTNSTTFDKGKLVAQIVIYYDTRRNLEKRGIQVVKRERTYLDELPAAFTPVGCKPPPGWRG